MVQINLDEVVIFIIVSLIQILVWQIKLLSVYLKLGAEGQNESTLSSGTKTQTKLRSDAMISRHSVYIIYNRWLTLCTAERINALL